MRTIWLTHLNAQDPQDGFRRACETQGWKVEAVSFIDVKAAAPPSQELNQKVARAKSIAFTSPRAVQFLFALLPEYIRAQLYQLPCYCIGGSTRDYAQAAGFHVQDCAADSAASLTQAMLALDAKAPVLFPCSDVRRDELVDGLRAGNLEVLELVVYLTAQKREEGLLEVKENWRKHRPEAVLVSSPSAVRVMDKKLRELEWNKVALYALGGSTLQALREAGFSGAQALGRPDPKSLLQALAH